MIHRYYPYNPALKRYIDHISFDGCVPGEKQFIPILPDGMTELVINPGNSHKRCFGEKADPITVKGSHFIGIKSHFQKKKYSNHTRIINIRFKPGAVLLFTNENMRGLKDSVIDAGELFSKEIYELEKKVTELKDEHEIISIIETFLLNKLAADEKVLQTMEIVRLVYKNPACSRIERIIEGTGLSYKQLERRFHAHVGLHPKLFMQIVKFNYATKIMFNESQTLLSQIAYKSGYFDQSHFIKDFKHFSGLLPKKYNPDNSSLMTRNQTVINSQFSSF